MPGVACTPSVDGGKPTVVKVFNVIDPSVYQGPQWVVIADQPAWFVHCPACGADVTIFGADGSGEDESPCPHLVFVYTSYFDVFYYQTAAFRERFGRVNPEYVRNYGDRTAFCNLAYKLPDQLRAAGYDHTLLVLQVEYSDIGSRIVPRTEVYGFDLRESDYRPTLRRYGRLGLRGPAGPVIQTAAKVRPAIAE